MIGKVLWLVASGGLVALVACSSDNAGDKYPDQASFCSALADAECKAVGDRCGVSAESCKNARVAACNASAGTLTGQGKTYQPGNAENCIGKTTELLNSTSITSDTQKAVDDVCLLVFSGAKAKDQPCTVPAGVPATTVDRGDCSGTLVCSKGLCADKVDKNIGEPCDDRGAVCAKGSYCQEQNPASFCVASNGVNEICTATAPCTDDLRCNGTCLVKFTPGQVCGGDTECSTGYCDSVAKKCAAKSFSVGNGACKAYGG